MTPGSIAFNTLVAGAIAATVVLVLTFIVSLTVVGTIVLAVVAIFDLFALIACKAGAKKACDIGIMSIITEALTDLIYTGGIMIDTDTERKADPAPPITAIKDLKMRLTNPQQGLVAGNGVQFSADLETTVRHLQPKPGIVYHFKSFFNYKDIQSTSVKYALGPVAQNLKPKANETTWWNVFQYRWVEQDVPAPVVGWLGQSTQSMTLWQANRKDWAVSPIYPFSRPQINQSFPLTLSIGMALPKFDCWYAACGHGTMQTTSYVNLSDPAGCPRPRDDLCRRSHQRRQERDQRQRRLHCRQSRSQLHRGRQDRRRHTAHGLGRLCWQPLSGQFAWRTDHLALRGCDGR